MDLKVGQLVRFENHFRFQNRLVLISKVSIPSDMIEFSDGQSIVEHTLSFILYPSLHVKYCCEATDIEKLLYTTLND